MIHGYLGAGKTTFARQLESQASVLRLTHDEWMLRLYGEDPPIAQFSELAERVSERLEYIWTRSVTCGLDVILDLNFWSRAQRDHVRALATERSAAVRLYRLKCSDDEAWKRISRRNKSLADSLFISRNTFEILRERFEPLDDDEPRIEISG
ncbi:MAG TPA: ATP-binding protein [Caulobacteraceae bacterium]